MHGVLHPCCPYSMMLQSTCNIYLYVKVKSKLKCLKNSSLQNASKCGERPPICEHRLLLSAHLLLPSAPSCVTAAKCCKHPWGRGQPLGQKLLIAELQAVRTAWAVASKPSYIVAFPLDCYLASLTSVTRRNLRRFYSTLVPHNQ